MTPAAALVTGAGRRVGRALALALAEDGWNVAVHVHRSIGEGEDVAERIRSAGRRAVVISGDLAEPSVPAALLARAVEELGPVTLLVNNAATFVADRLASLEAPQLRAQLAVNLEAPLLLARAFVAALPAERSGVVVNLVDQRALRPTAAYLSYTAAKAALLAATKVLARDLAPRVRVVAIAPGMPLPDEGMDPAVEARVRARAVLEEAGSLTDVVAALRFLVRAESVTGEVVVVDGGLSL